MEPISNRLLFWKRILTREYLARAAMNFSLMNFKAITKALRYAQTVAWTGQITGRGSARSNPSRDVVLSYGLWYYPGILTLEVSL